MTITLEPTAEPKNEQARQQAKAQLACIVELIEAYRKAEAIQDEEENTIWFDGERLDADDIRERIEQNALEVTVRSGWHAPFANEDEKKPEEFNILLCTGGPAVQIVGNLSQWSEPGSAVIQYQDWFTNWEDLRDLTTDENQALLDYCGFCYFGE